MAKINLAGLIESIQKVLDGVQQAAPLAQKYGGATVAGYATIAIAATGIIQNILERAKETDFVLSSQDEGKLRAMLEELQAANDKLAEAVSAS